MPGSYSVEAILADTALKTLQLAYDNKESQDVGRLIMEAYESVAQLKKAISGACGYGGMLDDPYELSESNSAV